MRGAPDIKSHSLVTAPAKAGSTVAVPEFVLAAGAFAGFAWEEFFIGKLRNGYTRQSYLRAVRRFLAWCEPQTALTRITPGMVGRYFDELRISVPSKKVHLAAIRSFFDVLVQRHVIVLNPAHSVRTERYSAIEGRTPEISVAQAKTLLSSIQLETVVDYRDRAIIAALIDTAARAGAVARLRLKDLVAEGNQFALRFDEKGGKARSIPVRHDLESFLDQYLTAAGLKEESKEQPFFRTAGARRSLFPIGR
jgi:site-specific recombinase XerD